MTDVHCHLAALPTPSNGCLLSKRMRESPLARAIAWAQDLPLDEPETANRRYLEGLDRELARSRLIQRAVLLAMDGVYDASGRLDEARTDFLVANDCVLAAAKGSPRLLAGVSINPMRRDAADEAERCADAGAALVKVLPNSQCFDPGEARFKGFYRTLARRKLALLSHVGFEFSLIGQDQSVGDPLRLRGALEEGVTVIAAHGCSTGLFVWERYLGAMKELAARHRNFYVDTSALTLPNRVGALWRLARSPELRDRLLFGTDYPLPVFAYPCAASPSAYLQARAADNRFDRQALVLSSLGLPPTVDFAALS
ncbi:MAG: amidohydrolase family protein [Elusimicrobia bacterium]|nr:amidohydrolase family protein [Elusimicrobiota bacterium]